MARKSTPASRRPVPVTTSVGNVPQPLALSDFHLRLEFLERENQKSIEQIEKKRHELNNLLDRIREIGVEISQRSMPLFRQLVEIDRQIHAVFVEIFNGRKLGKQTRKNVEKIYHNLQASGLISPNPNRAAEPEDEDVDVDDPDWDGSGYEDRHQEFNFRSEPEPEKIDRDELKKIRQLYLRLADVFHPDKVLDATDKEINQAYQAGDLAKLLKIEKQHQMGEIIDRNSEDDLARRCDRLEQENEFLKSQLTNIKKEIKVTKKSREGSMVADYRKMTKDGLDPIGEALAETELQIKTIDEVYQFVVDFRERRITIKEFMQGPPILQGMQELSPEELLMELFSQL
jgi:predicted  nucleic acid-binding Zn-ribbon protein